MVQSKIDIDGVAALRDFFLAHDGIELERTYRLLTREFRGRAPAVERWEDVEFVFNRLFVGPGALEAPPFASVYLEPEPLVMGSTTLDVREMYAAIGLESPWKNKLPDDHISLELDAALAMNHIVRKTTLQEMNGLRTRFITHMAAWVPQLVDRIRKAPSTHPAISFTAEYLNEWMKRQRER